MITTRATPLILKSENDDRRPPQWLILCIGLMLFCVASSPLCAYAQDSMSSSLPERDVKKMFAAAQDAGRVGSAQKVKPVDARPAKPGEVVVTMVAGVKETESKPARDGDMVVRNRSPETGNEEILVKAEEFKKRYSAVDGEADKDGWKEYRPIAPEMSYFIVSKAEGHFTFIAPWGEKMIAEAGDAIIQNPRNPEDTYRVAALAFKNTYVIRKKPRREE